MNQKEVLSIIGLGKLGSTMLACFAHKKWDVIGVDINPHFVETINKGHSPIYEPLVEELINANRERIEATVEIEFAVLHSDVSFLIVPTPSISNGSFSTEYVEVAVLDIARALRKKDTYHVIVITSTVLPGDTARISEMVEKESGKKLGEDFGICYNPDFIALGKIVRDFLNPDMILIGESDERAGATVEEIHRKLVDNNPPIYRMNFYNAELSKITLNSYCTLKITFANTIAEICESMPGGDADVVLKAVGSDSRVGNKYFKGGLGYAGPCLKPEGLVQTDMGLKQIQDIVVGDKVFTHKGRIRKVTKTYKRPYTGPMEKITSMGFPYCSMTLTPDHPVWGSKRVQRTKNKYRVVSTTGQKRLGPAAGLGELEFVSAFKMEHGDLTALPIIKEKDIKIPVLKFDLHWLNKIPAIIKLNPEIMKFFGFFISEGCTWRKEIKISLHKKEIHYAEELVGIIEKYFNSKAQIKPHSESCIKVIFTSTPLALYLKDTFGHTAKNKKVPFDWLFLPEKYLVELLRGIWYGDGSRSTDRFTYGTVSSELHRFLQLCSLRLGITFASKIQEEKVDKKGVKHQKAYFLSMSNGLTYKRANEVFPDLKISKIPKGSKSIWIEKENMLSTIRSVEEEYYQGNVHNLEVEDDNSYMLESGVVHNCFPRDNRALIHTSQGYGVTNLFSSDTDRINEYHKTERISKILLQYLHDRGSHHLAVLGLSYKEDTPVVEESVAIAVIKTLAKAGVECTLFDPAAMDNAEEALSGIENITFALSEYSCVKGVSVCFIATPWSQFKGLDSKRLLSVMGSDPLILDAWNVLPFDSASDRPENHLVVKRIGKN